MEQTPASEAAATLADGHLAQLLADAGDKMTALKVGCAQSLQLSYTALMHSLFPSSGFGGMLM
jgi:hypothetical protein